MAAACSLAACGGGNVGGVTAPSAPAASVVTQSIALPAAPAAGSTVAVALPAPAGIAPTLGLGAGYAAGTQLLVSAANYGQTAALKRVAQSTFASCPVLIDLTAYVTIALPAASIASYAVAYANALPFLGAGSFTAQIYDAGTTQSTGTPAPPAIGNDGCAIAPLATNVLASATGAVSGGTVTFSNFASNANLAATLQAKYGFTTANPAIPANTVFGIYVAFTPVALTATPSAAPTATPTATATATATAHASASPTASASASVAPTSSASVTPTASPTAAPTATPTAATTLATATLLGSAGFVSPTGRTVYILAGDSTTALTCLVGNGCTGAWPPVSPPNGVALSTGFTSFTRSDNNAAQLAYNGHPLYTFSGDTAAGQTNGNGINSFGGIWSIARP
jgi:predicted lipoprotein with Yx(FWY)xxD motif